MIASKEMDVSKFPESAPQNHTPEFIAFRFAGLFILISSTCGFGMLSSTFCSFGRAICCRRRIEKGQSPRKFN